jgi:hypothetical protein
VVLVAFGRMANSSSKRGGQPLRAKSDEILKKRLDLEGNGIRKLMAEEFSIIDDIKEQVWERKE